MVSLNRLTSLSNIGLVQHSSNQFKCDPARGVKTSKIKTAVLCLRWDLCPTECWSYSISHSHPQTDILTPKSPFVTKNCDWSKSRVISKIWIHCTYFWQAELNKIDEFGLGTKHLRIVRWQLDYGGGGVEQGCWQQSVVVRWQPLCHEKADLIQMWIVSCKKMNQLADSKVMI